MADLALVALVLLSACGEGRAPMVGVRDSAAAPDGASDSGPSDGGPPSRGDGGPALPGADHEVVLPFEGPEQTIALEVGAGAARLDIHLSIDTTGSFGEEIDTIQTELLERVLPRIRGRASDVAIGVSRFEDFPITPFGAIGDQPFELLTGITTSEDRVGAAIAGLDDPLGMGGDAPEASAEALYQIATGEGLVSGGRRHIDAYGGRSAPGGGDLGGVGFRDGSLRAVVHITDAPTHDPDDYRGTIEGTHSLTEAAEALNEMDVAVLGIASGPAARPFLERIALDTGAHIPSTTGSCPTGVEGMANPALGSLCPLVFDVARDGTGLSNAMADALVALLDSIRFEEVYGRSPDDELGFVRAIEAASATPPAGAPEPMRRDLHPTGDGVFDTFTDVRPGTELELVAHLYNGRIPQADYEQVFRLTIEVVGDGVVLAEEVVRVIVPRRAQIDPLPLDAATDSGGGDADGGIADAGDAS